MHSLTVPECIDRVLHDLASDGELPWEVWEQCFQTMQHCIDTVIRAHGAVVPFELRDEKTSAMVKHLIDSLVRIRAKDRTGAVIALAEALVKAGAADLLVSKRAARA